MLVSGTEGLRRNAVSEEGKPGIAGGMRADAGADGSGSETGAEYTPKGKSIFTLRRGLPLALLPGRWRGAGYDEWGNTVG
ncbi:hypothetical protein KCP73_01490 [Salmonella enterica subsp. enterica]|nr:hypothetical protein KCP73_01490 [Salmonella enterica subsp. enterica]